MTLKKISNGEMALVVSKTYVKQTEYRDKVFGITTPLFSSQLEMLCERGFPLLKRINKILGLFRDAGIMSKLRNDFRYNSTILIAVRELVKALSKADDLNVDTLNLLDEISDDEEDGEGESGPIPLRPEHLWGAISILLLGLLSGLAIFASEHLTNTIFFKNLKVKVEVPFDKFSLRLKKSSKKYLDKITCCSLKFPKILHFPRFSKIFQIFTSSKYFQFLRFSKLKKFFSRKREKKSEIQFLRRRVRRFAYRPIRFTPKGRRHPLFGVKKVI